MDGANGSYVSRDGNIVLLNPGDFHYRRAYAGLIIR